MLSGQRWELSHHFKAVHAPDLIFHRPGNAAPPSVMRQVNRLCPDGSQLGPID